MRAQRSPSINILTPLNVPHVRPIVALRWARPGALKRSEQQTATALVLVGYAFSLPARDTQ